MSAIDGFVFELHTESEIPRMCLQSCPFADLVMIAFYVFHQQLGRT